MTFSRPTLSDLVERIRGDFETRLPGADSRLRHSFLDVLARSHGGAAAGLYGFIDYLSRQLMPDTAEAEYLARWAAIWGIPRKVATPASLTVTATGENGSIVPVGTELLRGDGALYSVTAEATIAAGIAAVTVEAQEAGSAGDALIGSSLTFTSPVAGVAADVTVAAIAAVGTDDEDDEALLSRLLDRIQQPPLGGSANDYVQWALAQPGVTRAWSYPQWMGLGTVGVTFVMDGRVDILPTPVDIATVQAALDVLRPVTAELFVFAPTSRAVDVTLRISPDTAATRAAITAEMADFITREAVPGGTLYRSRLSEAVSAAEGEVHHELVIPYGDDVAGPGELHTLGAVSFIA